MSFSCPSFFARNLNFAKKRRPPESSLRFLFLIWRRERDSNSRSLRSTVFKTAAFDHSAIPPHTRYYTNLLKNVKCALYRYSSMVFTFAWNEKRSSVKTIRTHRNEESHALCHRKRLQYVPFGQDSKRCKQWHNLLLHQPFRTFFHTLPLETCAQRTYNAIFLNSLNFCRPALHTADDRAVFIFSY